MTIRRRGKRTRSRVFAFLVAVSLMLIGIVVPATPAAAASASWPALCSGVDYNTCINAGYTDHGYGEQPDWSTHSYWTMLAGHNCTNYAAYMAIQNHAPTPKYNLGSAADWASNASKSGVTVNGTPAAGAIAQYNAYAGESGSSGHVAYVESVAYNSDGTLNSITISEDNYGGAFRWRKIPAGDSDWPSNFIHFADLPTTPPPSNNFRAVFQSNTSQGYLYTYDSVAGTGVTDQGIMAGTSPSITYVPGHGWEAAFHAQNGDLFLWGDDGRADTLQGMMAGTSPSIAASSTGGFQVAFQANNGYMYLYNSTSGALNTGLGMMAGTSPAVAYVGGKGYEETFQANTGNLFVWGDVVSEDTQQGMMHTTSPAITGTTGGGFRVAFQANVGYMYLFDSVLGAIGTGQGMMANTSPSITALASGGYEEAFQANTGNLFVWDNKSYDTGQGMMGGTSPSIASSSTSNFRVAFQANNTYLYTYDAASGSLNTLQGIAAGTSPGMAGY